MFNEHRTKNMPLIGLLGLSGGVARAKAAAQEASVVTDEGLRAYILKVKRAIMPVNKTPVAI